MKKVIFGLIMALAISGAAYAENIPLDGNGNYGDAIWDGSTWLADTGQVAVSGTVDAEIQVGGADVSVTNGVPVEEVAYTSLEHDTAIATGGWDAISMSDTYDMAYISSDTDIYVMPYVAGMTIPNDASSGMLQSAGDIIPYPIATSTYWVRTQTGLATVHSVCTRIIGMNR